MPKLLFLKEYIGLIGIYTIVHFSLLMNRGIFWDDWIWVLNPDEFRIALSELGVVFLKSFFLETVTWPTWAAKLYVFLSFMVSGLFFFKSLKRLNFLDNRNLFLISLFFLVLPYNTVGRSAAYSTIIYTTSYLLFFAAYDLYLKYRTSVVSGWPASISILLSVLLFTLSFNMTSVLPFYVIIIFFTEIFLLKDRKDFKSYRPMFFKMAFICLHVLIFYLVKISLFPAHGTYAGYNSLSLSFSTFKEVLGEGTARAVFEPVVFSFFGKDISLFLKFNLKFLYLLLMWAPVIYFKYKNKHFEMKLALVSIVILWFSTLPYSAVSKMPDTYDWDSRHSILYPLGVALWLGSIFTCFANARLYKKVAVFFVLVFSVATLRLYVSVHGFYYQDLYLQTELNRYVKPERAELYVLSGNFVSGVLERRWRIYEPQGMLFIKHGIQNNLVFAHQDWESFSKSELLGNEKEYDKRLMVKRTERVEPFYCLKNTSDRKLSELDILKILYFEKLNEKDLFFIRIQQIANIEKSEINLLNSDCVIMSKKDEVAN